MIKESCNLIDQEHILLYHLKVYVIHKTNFSSEFNYNSIRNHSALLLMWPYHLQTNQVNTW